MGIAMGHSLGSAVLYPRNCPLTLPLHRMHLRFFILSSLLAGPGLAQTPHWIWAQGESLPVNIWVAKDFTIEADVTHARLAGSCDNLAKVYLDGEWVLESREWSRRSEASLAQRLTAGVHSLAAECTNQGGPAGLWLELIVEYEDGRKDRLCTDDSWLVSAEATPNWMLVSGDRTGWQYAQSQGELGCDPWGTPSLQPVEAASGALPAEDLDLPPGFEAQLLYSVPKETQGSWVSMAFDPSGRLSVSDQYGAIYRVSLPEWGEPIQAAAIEPLGVELGSAHGLLYAFGYLYVVVADAENTGLYRVGDENGDDELDTVEFLTSLDGSGEHGPHAVVLAPEGDALYVVGGNHTHLPDRITRTRPFKGWAEDQLLPRLSDPNGHAVGRLAPGGWVCRVSPDGQEWELVSMGMRNAYDIAFNSAGELFTFDSDMEWDVGLPWYRPTRILHLVSGSDYGWRHGSGKWPAHYPDTLPSVVDVGLGSPTGLAFGTQTRFHGPYRRALFAADWAYGTIHAVHLEEQGASYTARVETFVSGKPFQVTDLAPGPDGALYVTTGGRRTQSGLYRIRSTRTDSGQPEDQVLQPLAGGDRALRHSIERNHGLDALSPYWSELGHGDRFIVNAARVALEQTPTEYWADKALAEEDLSIALSALLALAHRDSPTHGAAILTRAPQLSMGDAQPEDWIDWLRLVGVVCARAGDAVLPEALALESLVARQFPSGHTELDQELCRLLAYLQSPTMAAKTLDLLYSSEHHATRIHYALCLSHLKAGWTLPLRRRYFAWLDGEALTLSGGHSLTKYLGQIRSQAVESLPAELRHWPELLQPPKVIEQAIEASAPRFVRAWTQSELMHLLPRLGAEPRDLARGKRWFERATCAECHRFEGAGGSTGPDLTGASSRFSPADLLESIMQPSLVISDQYQQIQLVTSDGEVFVGRIEHQDLESVVLRTGANLETLMEFTRNEIDGMKPSALSRMPTGLLDCLTEEAILDLLAYCLSN